MRETKRYKLPVIKLMSHRNEMYSLGNIVNNNVISLCGNRWSYSGDHFIMCRKISLLRFTPGINIVLSTNSQKKRSDLWGLGGRRIRWN